MRKFQAIYRVTVYTQDETVLVGAHIETDKNGKKQIVQDEAKLTCEFSVNRGILSDSSNCTIKLYNLALETREKINMDAFTFDQSKWKYVRLEAGYSGQLCRIFEGRILQAFSAHSGGSPDIVTEIQAQALDILDCQTSHTFEAGTTYKEAVQTIATTDMPNTTIGNVGELNGKFKTPTAVDGNVGDVLSSITGGQAFIDNGMLNVIMSNEVIDVPVPVITDDNGLLETPIRRDANMEVKILFQPDLIVGQLLEIKSAVAPKFNGQFKVVGFTHNCTISGAQAGTRITTVNLYLGPYLPGAQEVVSGQTQNNFNKVKGYEVEPVTLQTTSTSFIMPAKGRITSPFGKRKSPVAGGSTYHKGWDIGVPIGSKIVAIANGRVVNCGAAQGYGYWVKLDHGNINGANFTSEYGHISSWCVRVGQIIKQGQQIAKSGNTGYSSGPHLHFTLKRNGVAVNPKGYIKV